MEEFRTNSGRVYVEDGVLHRDEDWIKGMKTLYDGEPVIFLLAMGTLLAAITHSLAVIQFI